MSKLYFTRLLTVLLACVITLSFTGCGPNQRIIESGRNNNRSLNRPNSNMPPAVRSFESDIESMRTADFYNIHSFRRKDGEQLDADDKAFLAANLPGEVNRRMLSDEGKALIIGSNSRLPDEFLVILKERFLFDDFSAPAEDTPANSNQANTQLAK